MTTATVPCQLVLQVPQPNSRRAYAVALCDDVETIRAFARQMLTEAEAAVEDAPDVFSREAALIELEQLRARLCWATGLSLEDVSQGG